MTRATAVLAVLAALWPLTGLAQDEPYTETIIVGRAIVSVKIADATGKPILGLTPDDFVATIDGRPTDILSVTWVPENEYGRDLVGAPEIDQDLLDAIAQYPPAEGTTGRYFIFYFQTSFDRSTVSGQMNALTYFGRILDQMGPGDRGAILSFDSHLRLHVDFTDDRKALRAGANRTLRIGEPPIPAAVPPPSLAQCLTRAAMNAAIRQGQALLRIAEALREIPGSKQIFIVGTSFGTGPNWPHLKRELLAANAVVNVVYAPNPGTRGVSIAGITRITAETGGVLIPASFAGMSRIARELSGRYELELRIPPELEAGVYPLAVRGTKRNKVAVDGTLTIAEE